MVGLAGCTAIPMVAHGSRFSGFQQARFEKPGAQVIDFWTRLEDLQSRISHRFFVVVLQI
jgi:hypothetical protein